MSRIGSDKLLARFSIVLILSMAMSTLPDAKLLAAPLPNTSRTELEHQISSILSSHTYFDASGGTASVHIWGDAPHASAALLAETTAHFEGCVVVIRLERPGLCRVGSSWYGKEEWIDLSFLADGAKVSPPLSGYESLGATVQYDFRPEIAGQLVGIADRSARIFDEAHFPADIPARMLWLEDALASNLEGPTFKGAQIRTAACPGYGEGFAEPLLNSSLHTFQVDPKRSEEFVTLVRTYKNMHCRG